MCIREKHLFHNDISPHFKFLWSNERLDFSEFFNKRSKEKMHISFPVAQWLEHCVSSAKVVGSIPREHMYWQKKCITWMHCKSLWIKASAKCINILIYTALFDHIYQGCLYLWSWLYKYIYTFISLNDKTIILYYINQDKAYGFNGKFSCQYWVEMLNYFYFKICANMETVFQKQTLSDYSPGVKSVTTSPSLLYTKD